MLAAERQLPKEKHDSQIKGALLAIEKDQGTLFKQTVLKIWLDYVQEIRGDGLDAETQRRIAYYKQLHKGGVRQAMTRLAESSDSAFTREAFAAWRELLRAEKNNQIMKCHRAKGDHVLDKALVKWADGNNPLLLHTVWREWVDEIAQAKEDFLKAEQQAERERMKEIHDQKVEGILLKMTGASSRTHMAVCFREWNVVILDKHQAAQTGIAAEAACLREMHRADVRGLMFRLLDGQDWTDLGACFGVWKESLTDGRIEAEFVTAGQRHNHKHDYIVDKAFLYWGDSDSVLLQATIMKEWRAHLSEERLA